MMNELNIQNAIRLVKVTFPSFNVNSPDVLQQQGFSNLTMSLEHSIVFGDSADSFIVKFVLKLSDRENDFNADFIMNAFFKAKELMDEGFKNSSFVNINAPAIAFPFLRSFVTTITANAGYSPIFLPSVNFTKQ